MIELSIKLSETDKEMVELIGKTHSDSPILWAVCHSDLVYEDTDLYTALGYGEEIPMKLMKL